MGGSLVVRPLCDAVGYNFTYGRERALEGVVSGIVIGALRTVVDVLVEFWYIWALVVGIALVSAMIRGR